MTPNSEQQILAGISEVQRDVTSIRIKLFGDEDRETSKGRIPMLESTQDLHAKRIKDLEKLALRAATIVGVILFCIEMFAHWRLK